MADKNQNKEMFGDRIKRRRKEIGMTQKALAEAAGFAEITIRQYESGKYVPKIEARVAIANALKTSVSDLFPQELRHFDSPDDFHEAWNKPCDGAEIKTDHVADRPSHNELVADEGIDIRMLSADELSELRTYRDFLIYRREKEKD